MIRTPVRVLALCLSTLFIPLSAAASIITVNPGPGTIQAGINAASNGDTVLLSSGFYQESGILVNKSVLVTGEFGDWATIDGASHATNAIFRVIPPAVPHFRYLILQKAGGGIFSRVNSGSPYTWSAESLVLHQLSTAIGIDDDRPPGQGLGSASWRNLTVVGCDVAFGLNDAAGATIQDVVVSSCGVAFDRVNANSMTVDCAVVWQTPTILAGTPNADTSRVALSDPKFLSPNSNFCVTAGSPCLPSNNPCGRLLGAIDDDCTSAVPAVRVPGLLAVPLLALGFAVLWRCRLRVA